MSIPHDPWLALAFVAIGGVIITLSWLDLRLGKAAQAWPAASGTIVVREISRANGGRNTWTPIVRYCYSVQGARYDGDRLSFRAFWTASGAIRAVYHYEPHQVVSVRYDPTHPERSVLEPEIDDRPWVRLGVGILFLIAAILTLI